MGRGIEKGNAEVGQREKEGSWNGKSRKGRGNQGKRPW